MKHLKTLPVKGTDTAALFGTEKIGKILFRIAPPVMLAQLILALYNVVDSYFVGKFSDDGLTGAVGYLSDSAVYHRACRWHGRRRQYAYGAPLCTR